ncbi:MAG: Crp/Fnr family transcriptional regulator [Acetatifactor sp.]|nr:Crp/Fnr family transcriptional regulator [Acetatifactor sp.]
MLELTDFFPIWDQLTTAQQKRLLDTVRPQSVNAGATIHNGSMDCTGLLLIQSGQLRAFITSPDGREITIYRLLDRDICLFSASCMIQSLQFDITVEAEKNTQFLRIPSDVYKQIMEESAVLANYTNQLMASRFSDVMWLVEQIMWKSFDQRLASFLLEEAALENTLTLKITHEAIANHLGTAREVVTRMLHYFQAEGMVKLTRGTIEIIDQVSLSRFEDVEK